jgi:hypothetical protein
LVGLVLLCYRVEITAECDDIKAEVVDELENRLSKAIMGHFPKGNQSLQRL